MEKFTVLLTCSLFLQLMAHGQSAPTKKEQYDFLRWFITYKHATPLSDTASQFTDDILAISNVKRTLSWSIKMTNSDWAYLKRQISTANRAGLLDTSLLKNVLWKTNFQDYLPFSYISLPIFIKSKRMVLVKFGYYCGMTCGNEGIEVYIRDKKRKWRLSNHFNFPVTMF